MRCHGTSHPCYGVFNIQGHTELHTNGGASRNAVAWDIAPMLWFFNIKGHNELHTQVGASRNAVAWYTAPMLWCF